MKSTVRILYVEDSKLLAESVKRKLCQFGNVDHVVCLSEALIKLKNHSYDMAFIDLDLEYRHAGVDLLKETIKSKIYSVVMTAHEEQELIDKCYFLGCNDYFTKGNEKVIIPEIMNKFLNSGIGHVIEQFTTNEYITNDQKTIEQLKKVFKNARSAHPMLILGPTGIGKTLLAQKIHSLSNRVGNFVNLNVANINIELLESHLFGAKKGSHNQADKDRTGLLEEADKGTLFLDEIASASIEIQRKLLKAIDEKEFYPLGSNRPVKSDFRLISATCDDLDILISKKRFREDFYRRINAVKVELPALKERLGDIPLLIKHFTKNSKQLSLASDTYKILYGYDWPYNISELINLIGYLQSLDTGYITPDCLPPNFQRPANGPLNTDIDVSNLELKITEEQFEFAKQKGSSALIREIKKQLIDRCLKSGTKDPYEKLKISKATFYRHSQETTC